MDLIHFILILVWIGGFCLFFFVGRFPRLRISHAIFGLSLAAIQVAFATKCPLTILSDHLQDLADPGSVDWAVYQPFITRVIYGLTGMHVPHLAINIFAGFGTGVMLWTLIRVWWRRRQLSADYSGNSTSNDADAR